MGNLSLDKLEAKVKLSLEKHDVLVAPTVRVGQALDISGSMEGLYYDGSVAKVVLRTLALAKTFDDNGEMDMRAFNNQVHELPVATEDNFETFVEKHIIRGVRVGGGTSYAPCLQSFYDFYFPAEGQKTASPGFLGKLFGKKAEAASTEEIPALVLFITDGENDDYRQAEAVLRESQGKPIYWLMIGIGNQRFAFLEAVAEKYPNVGLLKFNDLDMDDEELYDGIINEEFVEWVTKV